MNRRGIILLAIICTVFMNSGDIICNDKNYMDVHIHLDPMALSNKGPSLGKKPRNNAPYNRGKINNQDLAKNIISLMDKMEVKRVILMPPPQVPEQEGTVYDYKACIEVAKYYSDRILIGGGGNNLNPMIYKYEKDQITPEVKAQFRKEAEKLIKAGIKVFGEMAALHLSMQEHHIFAQVEPDHPLLLLLADIAAENNIPIDLHMEAVPEDVPMPGHLLKVSSHNPKMLKANISSFERLLEHNRKAKIVWQHIGWDNIGFMTIELLTDLLNKHPNLFLAIRVENRQTKLDRSGRMPNRIVDSEWKIYPEWIKFLNDFSDRIVIGSDEFMGMARSGPSRPKDSFVKTWSVLDLLPEETAHKIGSINALQIYGIN